MAKEGGYTINPIYSGGFSSLKSNYENSTSYDPLIKVGSLGITTHPNVANVLQEVSSKLATGAKQIEIEGVSPEVFDSMPKQQLKEVNRITKLTGSEVSLHGPVTRMNMAGITQQGFDEAVREENERKVLNTLVRAKDLNPDGHIPVNFHSAEGIPSSTFLPPSERKKAGTDYKTLLVINQGKGGRGIIPLEAETRYYLGEQGLRPKFDKAFEEGKLTPAEINKNPEKYMAPLGEGRHETPEERLKILNHSEWSNKLDQLFFNQERAKEILDRTKPFMEPFMNPKTGRIELNSSTVPHEKINKIKSNFDQAGVYLRDLRMQLNNMFSDAYQYGTKEQKNALEKVRDNFQEQLNNDPSPFGQAQALQNVITILNKPEYVPNMYVPLEKFAAEKTGETFGNAAFNAYKEFKGKNVPTLVIENPPAGFGLSTGKDLRNVVEKSQKQFVDNAMKPKDQGGLGMSKNKAEEEAKKLIGATWDVGHINMLRKFGYSEKEIIKESEEIAPYIKHVHLSDNFGFEHTELPMGMGNVPLKEIMGKLGQKGYEAKKIIEAGSWINQFKTPGFQEALGGIGSPIYGMKMAPYWDQSAGLYQSYSEGMQGQWLPQINYETFGSGFSRLPPELGGSRPGAQGSRMSGRPMQ